MTRRPHKSTDDAPDGRDRKSGRFAKGNGYGPGRPPAPWRALARGTVTDDDLRTLFASLRDRALDGDIEAARLVLSYVIGSPGKARDPVAIALPKVATARDLPPMLAAVVDALRAGTLEPTEAVDLVRVADVVGAAFERADLEDRIASLEARR